MENIELELSYINKTFGKPTPRGEWPIRGDVKKYSLLVDKIPVIDIEVEYQRFNEKNPNYSCAFISYYNNFFNNPSSPYNNKGYATMALNLVTEMLLKENIPRLTLSILDDNERSKSVARKGNYQLIENDNYSVFHPNAIKLYEEGLKELKEEDEEIYFLQMERFLRQYQKYVISLQENKNTKSK